jgi:transcriptional regulator with XRE-family HTH domain
LSRLAKFRKRFRVTQPEMAKILGVSTSAYAKWEYGERSIPTSSQTSLANLGLDLGWLEGGDGGMLWKPHNEVVAEIHRRVSRGTLKAHPTTFSEALDEMSLGPERRARELNVVPNAQAIVKEDSDEYGSTAAEAYRQATSGEEVKIEPRDRVDTGFPTQEIKLAFETVLSLYPLPQSEDQIPQAHREALINAGTTLAGLLKSGVKIREALDLVRPLLSQASGNARQAG